MAVSKDGLQHRFVILGTSYSGRIELKCVFCDRLDPMEMAEPQKWADGPLGIPISGPVP